MFRLRSWASSMIRKPDLFRQFFAQRAQALCTDQPANLIETELMLEILRIGHESLCCSVNQFSSMVFSERNSGRIVYSSFSVPRRSWNVHIFVLEGFTYCAK